MERQASSVSMLAARVREVGAADRARDEEALRAELAALAAEASLLATMDPLLPDG